MAGLYLRLREQLGPAIMGAWEAYVGWSWSTLVPRDWPVAWWDTRPFGQGFRVQTEQSMGCV